MSILRFQPYHPNHILLCYTTSSTFFFHFSLLFLLAFPGVYFMRFISMESDIFFLIVISISDVPYAFLTR